MSLPNEIDQDVKCPSCDRELVIYDSGDGYCPGVNCSERKFSPKHIAALRNQLPPNHTAIPNAELEALREAEVAWSTCKVGDVQDAVVRRNTCVNAILAHLPAKKPDYVARLRDIRDRLWANESAALHGRPRDKDADQIALRVAIEKMEKP